MKRRIVEEKSETSKTELKTMRKSKIYYTRIRATTNKTGRRNVIFVCPGEDQKITKKRFEEMKGTGIDCTLYYGEKGSNKIEKGETESSVSMQGGRLYRQSFEERLQSDTRTC